VSVSPDAYVLDSFAVLAFLEGESGGSRVKEILVAGAHGRCRLYLSLINLGEVLYICEREKSVAAAQQVLAAVEQLPVEILPSSRQAVLAAAHVKAQFPVAYADAFAVVAAREHDGCVVTGDPEFRAVEGFVRFEWLS
jgi:ribonuclease VapC